MYSSWPNSIPTTTFATKHVPFDFYYPHNNLYVSLFLRSLCLADLVRKTLESYNKMPASSYSPPNLRHPPMTKPKTTKTNSLWALFPSWLGKLAVFDRIMIEEFRFRFSFRSHSVGIQCLATLPFLIGLRSQQMPRSANHSSVRPHSTQCLV